ncbi:MAG TPA: prepilin-type N-terminal cleavage/methylation domain-containing protein [Rhodocyclaceae bacterium]|nr:prepilin-type N-terminal cleavage/methylation domain-containing protein [Rhodocyclaceae bacterium]
MAREQKMRVEHQPIGQKGNRTFVHLLINLSGFRHQTRPKAGFRGIIPPKMRAWGLLVSQQSHTKGETDMKSSQKGFTLVEIAIVLVIIGLLLGGVLKGQELINSAKVKNFATDFPNIPLYIYGYQDKFKSLPGDDSNPVAHVNGVKATSAGQTQGNAVIEGFWNSATATDESYLFWQHVRLAGLAAGPTDLTIAAGEYLPKNADGGQIGIESGSAHYIKDAGAGATTFMSGTYIVCSQGILGKFAKQLDITLDDGNTETGSVRAVTIGHTRGNAAVATNAIDDATSYIVCMGI